MNSYCNEVSIFESVRFLNEGILDEKQIYKHYLEKFKHYLEKLKDIGNKIQKTSDEEKIKKFIDENYINIVKAIKVCSKEPKDMEIIDLENVILLLLSIISGLLGAIFTVAKVSSCLTTFLCIISILFLILSAMHEINENKYRETKRKYYSDFFNNLSSIRKSLEKILYKNANALPDNYKNKIIDLLDKMEEILDEPA